MHTRTSHTCMAMSHCFARALVLHKKDQKLKNDDNQQREKSNSSLSVRNGAGGNASPLHRPTTTQRAHCSNCVSQETASYSSVTLQGYVRSAAATCPCVPVCVEHSTKIFLPSIHSDSINQFKMSAVSSPHEKHLYGRMVHSKYRFGLLKCGTLCIAFAQHKSIGKVSCLKT